MRVKQLEQILGNEWIITPAGGATGEAYIAQYEERKLFLKRNSSPFLAVLSAEGIVPKLVWTRRLENGDVISAQQWLNGRELKPKDMQQYDVARLLQKIHYSKELLNMLKRLGKMPLLPHNILDETITKISEELKDVPIVKEVLDYLQHSVDEVACDEKVVCHCDINHNNWLLSEKNELYLIDWDGAMIADPAIDIGMLLYWYVPKAEWQSWLTLYGIDLTDSLQSRMKWYVLIQTLLTIQWNKERKNEKEMKHSLRYLRDVLTQD